MQATDAKRFRDLLRGMGRMFGQEPDGLVLDAYWLALRDWDYADFESAAAHLMAHAKFMPRPGEFNQLRKAALPTAGESWASVLDYVRRGFHRWIGGGVSVNDSVKPELDPVTTRAVQAMGGFQTIAMCDEEKLHFLERRFCEHFESIQDAQQVREALPNLALDARPSLGAECDGKSRSSFKRVGFTQDIEP